MNKKRTKKTVDTIDPCQMNLNFTKSNVINLRGAIDRKKIEAQSSSEKDALKAILERARKLNW